MKKNNIYYLLVMFAALLFTACSKKSNMSASSNQELKMMSQRLEMNYEPSNGNNVTAPDNAVASSDANVPSLKVEDEPLAKYKSSKKENLGLEAKTPQELEKDRIQKAKIEKLKNNTLLNKIVAKKVEKTLKKQGLKNTQDATGGIWTGIVVGAIGLILIATASLFGGASTLVYVAGAVLFVVGVILILAGAL